MVDFRDIIANLQDWGFFDVVLPFLLVYVIVFAILERAQIFKVTGDGADNSHVRNVNAIIAFVFALFVVASIQTVRYIQDLIINVVLILIFIMVALILLGFIFGKEYMQFFVKDGEITTTGKVLAGIFAVAIVIILLWILGWLDPILELFEGAGGIEEGTISTVLFLLALAGVLFWITRSSGSSGTDSKGDSE